MEITNVINKKYIENKQRLKISFQEAYDFLENIENSIDRGFHVGTHKNLHLYFKENFLLYFEIISSKVVKISSKYNGNIKHETKNNSEYLFSSLLEKLNSSNIIPDENIEIDTSRKYEITISKSRSSQLFFRILMETINHIKEQVGLLNLNNQLQELNQELQIYCPENNETDKKLLEGVQKVMTVTVYERNKEAREKCIEHWKCVCAICGFDFEKVYGKIGTGYIHVHHLNPISTIKEEYKIDPINDMRPVCPNCHSIIHRDKDNVMTIEELKQEIERQKNNGC